MIPSFSEHALLRARLETGRTHQIRVHLAAIGLPVSGEPVYRAAGDLGLARQFSTPRVSPSRIRFCGKRGEGESPLPDDLGTALARARQ
jgi:23S rRNA pseudouridine1911/1915/1917 synthase